MKICCAHLNNDYTGSTIILARTIEAMLECGHSVVLIASDSIGALTELPNSKVFIKYSRRKSKLFTLINYFSFQIQLWKRLSAINLSKNDIIYINTLLPFAAALYGKMRSIKVVFHLHELGVGSNWLYRFLVFINKITSTLNIFVSSQHRLLFGLTRTSCNQLIIPNPSRFNNSHFSESKVTFLAKQRYFSKRNIVFISSHRYYKGWKTFFTLASLFAMDPAFCFTYICNEADETVCKILQSESLPPNLKVVGRAKDLSDYYANAFVVLNLSIPQFWVETFGLTLIEAMSFGVPVIAPAYGGPSEIINDHTSGILLHDPEDLELISQAIYVLSSSLESYVRFSLAAHDRSKQFSLETFSSRIQSLLQSL
jgi:glycosyltransferase involved in cell wall biosynthesis